MPNRYLAITRLLRKVQIVDRYETRFGSRSLRFDANTGLHVNFSR